jgi:hypothetical protein
MLNQVECDEGLWSETTTPPKGSLVPNRSRSIWVYSKSQAPYEFRPWADPCSPREWPYNLQALRGTEDYADILSWFCARHPKVSRDDLELLIGELIRRVGPRQISVEIYHDIDTQERSPTFLVWGFASLPTDEEEAMMEAFRQWWRDRADLRHLRFVVEVSPRSGIFEDRHACDWR